MEYKKYMKLGFKREDSDCRYEFGQTGYNSFELTRAINDKAFISVKSWSMDSPVLFIKKRFNKGHHHEIKLTPEQVRDICD